jgi:hypothetical protein
MAKTKKGIIKKAIMGTITDGTAAHEGAESKKKEVGEGKNDNEKDLPFQKYSNLKK